jgi:hypothetical protein
MRHRYVCGMRRQDLSWETRGLPRSARRRRVGAAPGERLGVRRAQARRRGLSRGQYPRCRLRSWIRSILGVCTLDAFCPSLVRHMTPIGAPQCGLGQDTGSLVSIFGSPPFGGKFVAFHSGFVALTDSSPCSGTTPRSSVSHAQPAHTRGSAAF